MPWHIGAHDNMIICAQVMERKIIEVLTVNLKLRNSKGSFANDVSQKIFFY
jgi:hypothetical protein